MTLSAVEFLRRLLLQVLPDGFQRIRYYGFIANRQRTDALALCRQLLNSPAPEAPSESLSYPERLKHLTGKDILQCPICTLGQMMRIREFGRGAKNRQFMITKPQPTRPTLASHRHARCTCAHATNSLPELKDLLRRCLYRRSPVDLRSPESVILLIPPLRDLPAIKIQKT